MVGLDSHALQAFLRDHHRLIFAVLADGRIDQQEAELLFVTLSVAAVERASQGKSVEQIAGELASKVTALLADVFTTDLDELEERYKQAQISNDLTRAARIAARIDKVRAKEGKEAHRKRLPPPVPLPREFPPPQSSPPVQSPTPHPVELVPEVDLVDVDLSAVIPPATPSIDAPQQPVHKEPRHVVYEVDPKTGQKVPKDPFGGRAR